MKLGRRSTPAVSILFVEGYIFLRLYMRFVYCVARARSLKKTLDVHAYLRVLRILRMRTTNKVDRPFPSCLKPLFQSEAKREAIYMKIIFCFHANKTQFHNQGLAFSLVSKLGVFGTRKWPIRKASFQHFFTRERKNNNNDNLN